MNRPAVILVAVLATTTACSVGGEIDGPLLRSTGSSGGGSDAIVAGEVVLDDGCLLLDGRTPVVWPDGTTWQADPAAVVLPGGEVVETGGMVHGSGGFHDRDQVASMITAEIADAAAECAGPDGEIAVFNPGSDVEAGLP